MPVCRETNGKYKNCHKMPDGSMMKGKKHSNSLTPKQKAKLPVALQNAILAKRKK